MKGLAVNAMDEPANAANEGLVGKPPLRKQLSRVGYVLVGCSVLMALIVWPWTCAMGGFHCFDGGAGHVMSVAQIGVLLGVVCSLCGTGPWRLLAAVGGLIELVACFRQGLVH